MTIEGIYPECLGASIAQLVWEGLCFRAEPMPGFDGRWRVILTGGF